ncbi:glycosyltransferase family 4 protein [Micromonospora sp. FIMYZ51]|uniref:glycosyltransferase family 4 protein n=1 Tax=Micromonospora sp. FIMYZ51 TaxID=3051832 RepID=UPI00311DD632
MAQVLFIIDVPTPYRNPVLNHLHREGLDVLALYHWSTAGRGWGSVVPDHPHQILSGGRIARCATAIRAVRDPDLKVLCCYGYARPANVLAVLLARLRGVRIVLRSDSNWLREQRRPRYRRWAKRLLLRAIFGRRARVWTVGAVNDRYWAEYGFPDRHLIPYGLPHPPVASPPEATAFRARHDLGAGFVVLFVGRLEQIKGVDTLLAAFRATDDPDSRLVIVGNGPTRSIVDHAAAADPRIRVLGALPQEELGPVYAAADLFVLPSRSEAWGLVVAEAQANGVRVAVSDVVGCHPDLVTPDNGWVFPVDDVERLTGVLAEARALKSANRIRIPPTPAYHAGPAMLVELAAAGVRPRPLSRH